MLPWTLVSNSSRWISRRVPWMRMTVEGQGVHHHGERSSVSEVHQQRRWQQREEDRVKEAERLDQA